MIVGRTVADHEALKINHQTSRLCGLRSKRHNPTSTNGCIPMGTRRRKQARRPLGCPGRWLGTRSGRNGRHNSRRTPKTCPWHALDDVPRNQAGNCTSHWPCGHRLITQDGATQFGQPEAFARKRAETTHQRRCNQMDHRYMKTQRRQGTPKTQRWRWCSKRTDWGLMCRWLVGTMDPVPRTNHPQPMNIRGLNNTQDAMSGWGSEG